MIKLFEQYNEYNKVKKWLDKMCIKNYTINDDLTVDVNGQVYLHNKDIGENGGMPIQFGRVNGSFSCSNNNLTSLKGCPEYVGGAFHCSKNKLTTLEYCPKYIGDDFYCSYNKLTSLKGCPEQVELDFDCNDNRLTSLINAPMKVNGNFVFGHNPLPKEILDLHIDHNFLLENQEEYGIWNNDGSFNLARFNILIEDYFKDFEFSTDDDEDDY